ncbi:MAG TPA: EAL domain-containing protein [Limnochordia bacterium]|nr:EAL domain-containing protein [Limnochordia bacterium]
MLVLTLFVLTTTGMLTRALVNDLVEDRALDLVQNQSHIIHRWLAERVTELELQANSSILETLDWNTIEPYLQRRISQSADYFLLYFMATPDGLYHTTSMRNAGRVDDRSYFPKVMAGETAISEPLISRSTDERIIVIATPIWSEDGMEVTSLLGLSIDLVTMLQDSANLVRDDTDMRMYLVDSEGYFILHDDPDLIMYGRFQDIYTNWDEEGTQETNSFTGTRDGVDYRVFYHKLSGISDWSVVVEVPMSFFSQPVNSLMLRLLLVSVFGLILVVVLGSWFASTISEPIVDLNQIFKRGAQGDLTVRAKVTSADELGETRSSFNQMMNTIGTMTYYDPLTGLPNRQHFLDSLEKSLAENATVILVLVSLRDLSEIKTLVGPKVTDGILRTLAETLQAVSDDSLIMGRMADAEFGMIIPSSTNGVLRTIDRLDNLLGHPLHFAANDVSLHIYGGISISEGDDLQADAFLQQAQTALYEAEHSAGEQLKLYNSKTHHAMVERLRFQSEIRAGLDKKEFVAFYQPIVDLESNVVVGKEALIRWQHPTRELLMPADFLQAAEQGGFIDEIGEYMLHWVCSQHQVWLAEGLNLGWVAVNVSANHFRSPHFPDLLKTILRTYKLSASILRIEITEETMLSPTPDVLQNFEQLRKMGVHVAIDDFGTAYSTLEYLIRYPVESLKIDKAFIDQVDVGFRAQGLVRSIVGMGRNLSMGIVAEGVERENQLHLLRTMDCNEAQGYLFSRPLPAEEYPAASLELDNRLKSEA